MAYLSNYLGGGSLYPRRTTSTRRNYGTPYAYPKSYQPYQVARRGVSGIQQSNPFGGQDLASALLQQKQVSQASAPSSNFESSYNYDPILSKIQALATQSVNNANTNAAQLRKDALISSGQVPIGQALGFDANTLSAAGQNPESEYAQLQKEFAVRQKQLEEVMSAQNLLYSGEYTNNLSLLNQGRASAEGGIGARLRDMLSGIDTGVLGAQETARQEALNASQDAALARHYVETNFTPGDMSDFQYGANIPAGYTLEQLKAQADAQAPAGAQAMHIMNQGAIQDGMYSIKYQMPDGTTNTIWIPLPATAATAPTDTGVTPQVAPQLSPTPTIQEQLALAASAPADPYLQTYRTATGQLYQ